MVDQPQAGSGSPGIPAAGTGTALEGSGTGGADPFAGLQDAGIREWVGKAGIKDTTVSSFESVAKIAREAQSLIGRSIVIPDDKAKPEDWDKVYARLGRPDVADKYDFKLPDGLPEGFAYDKDRATAFKSWAHQNGLTPKQAQGLHDAVVKADAETWGKAGAEAKKVQEAATAKAAESTQALEKAFGGARDTEAFQQGVQMAVRAIEGLDRLPGTSGILKAFEEAGLVVDDGKGAKIVLNPTIAIALSHVGKAMFKEGTLVTGSGAGVAGDNPFTGTGNVTEQMRLMRSDPDTARRMIAVLGKKTSDFGWDGADIKLPR